MYARLLTCILFLLAACQSRKSETKSTDSTTVTIDTTSSSEPEVPLNKREEEQVISFSEFYNKYIKTKTIGTLQLPIVFGDDDMAGTSIYESPEGAFENIPKRNGPVQVLGLLPDTSRYYGIVYALNLMRPVTYMPSDFYSPRIATFSRDGKFIARAEVITNSNFDGASSCGKVENGQRGFIDKDLSFFGMHALIQNCENEGNGRKRPILVHDMNYGRVSADGTIYLRKEEHDDQGDDNTPPFIGYALLNEKELVAKMKTNANLGGTDLLAFFPESDLRSKTEYWVWYSLRYPAENHSIVAAVRRIKNEGSRKRHYGIVVVTDDERSKPYNFYFEDDMVIENNEPDIQLLHDRMIIIVISTADGKSVAEDVKLIPFSNGDFSVALSQLSKPELEFERNWILAHNGLKFDSPTVLADFSKYDWYKPTVTTLPINDLPYYDRLAVNQIDGLMR
jgi:hypothetical protein